METALQISNVIGQERARKILTRSVNTDRMSHAYLFKGPDGVGKRLAGRWLAAVVNCRDRNEVEPCGNCSSCRKFISGNHPDFHVVSPEKGVIKIDQIREVCKLVSYPPYESRMRVILLEDVHGMRVEAANALLKTLEEPPEQNLLVLTADTAVQILPTITSRCQVVSFFSLTDDQTRQILGGFDLDIDEEDLDLLSWAAEGSPGKGLRIYEGGLLPLFREVDDFLAKGQKDEDKNILPVLQLAGKTAKLEENLPLFLQMLKLGVRDELVSGYSRKEESGATLKGWSYEQLFAKLKMIDEALLRLARNCNRTLVCEVLFFALQQIKWNKKKEKQIHV